MTTVPDHYELLGLQQTAGDEVLSPEELKRAYKRALLRHHPDKQHRPEPGAQSTHATSATIDEISVAYQTLSDPFRRAEYDRTLEVARAEQAGVGAPLYTGVETVDLGELDCDEDAGLWTRSCRCGSQPAFVVTEEALEEHAELGEVTIGCKGCSLWLRILYSVDG